MLLYPHGRSWPDHVFRIGVEVFFFEIGELLLEGAYSVLEVDNEIARDLGALGLIEVFAVGIRAFTRPASWQTDVASGLPLEEAVSIAPVDDGYLAHSHSDSDSTPSTCARFVACSLRSRHVHCLRA